MLLDHFAKRRCLKETLKLFEWITGPLSQLLAPKVVTYNSMIDAYVRIGKLSKAFMFLDNEILNHPDLDYDSFTITALARGIQTPSEASYLNRIFGLVEGASFQLEIIVFNVLIEACNHAQQPAKAYGLFRQMDYQNFSRELQAADYGEDRLGLLRSAKPEYLVKPDVVTYNTLIKASCQNGNLDGAFNFLQVLKLSEDLKPNDVTYNTLIDGCTRTRGRMDTAWRLLEEMYREGVAPDSFTFSTLVKGIKKHASRDSSESLKRALRFLNTVAEEGLAKGDEVLYNCIMDTCLYFRQLNKAEQLFREMQLRGVKPSSVTYGILIKGYGQFKRLDLALKKYGEMADRGLKPNEVTYGCLIDACVNNNQIDRALSIFEEMESCGTKPNTIIYTTLIKGFARKKELKSAMRLYETMKHRMRSGECTPNNVTYNSLLDCCVRCGNLDLALQIWGEMEVATTPDLISYSTLIKGYCQETKIKEAFQLLDVMIEKHQIMPDEVLFNSLLDGCVRADAFKIGEMVFQKMQQSQLTLSVVAYSIMVKLYGKMGELDQAFTMLAMIKQNRLKPGLIVFTCLVKACLQAKNARRALDAFEMLKQELFPDKVVYQTLIQGLLGLEGWTTTAAQYALEAWREFGISVVDDLQNSLLQRLETVKPYPGSLVKEVQMLRGQNGGGHSQQKHGYQQQHTRKDKNWEKKPQWKRKQQPKFVKKDIEPKEEVKEERAPFTTLTTLTNRDLNRPARKQDWKQQQSFDEPNEKENLGHQLQKKAGRKPLAPRENYQLQRF